MFYAIFEKGKGQQVNKARSDAQFLLQAYADFDEPPESSGEDAEEQRCALVAFPPALKIRFSDLESIGGSFHARRQNRRTYLGPRIA